MNEHIEPYSIENWPEFVALYRLSTRQQEQFARYYQLLQEWNQRINLTAIKEPKQIIADHFDDSLRITQLIDFSSINGLVDVGSGAGFPGIPLSIFYPEKTIILIEVVGKKISFLEEVIKQLGLTNCSVYRQDWLTFIRSSHYKVQLFCARASLQPKDLLKVFQEAGWYKKTQIVYWASAQWKPENEREQRFIVNQQEYVVGQKQRKLIFFSA